MGSPEFLTSLVTGGDIWGCNPRDDVCVAIHSPAEKSIKHPGRSRTDVTQARRYVMANGDSNKPGRTPDARKPGHDQIPREWHYQADPLHPKSIREQFFVSLDKPQLE